MQFHATHFMSLQNALYSIPSVQHTLCHCERKNGVPAGYCVPVGLMVAFLQCDKRNNRGFQKIFVVRDVNPCVFLNFVI